MCHLRIKSAPFFMDLKFKSAPLVLGSFELSIEGVESGEILAQPSCVESRQSRKGQNLEALVALCG